MINYDLISCIFHLFGKINDWKLNWKKERKSAKMKDFQILGLNCKFYKVDLGHKMMIEGSIKSIGCK